MTGIQPELWADDASAAVEFYEAAFGATVLHCVGDSAASDEHGWRLGRILDQFGHEWQTVHPTADGLVAANVASSFPGVAIMRSCV